MRPAEDTVAEGDASHLVRLDLTGHITAAAGSGEDKLKTKSNYLVGDRDGWLTDIDNYAAVRYEGVYQSIHLRYYGTRRQLEYDFFDGDRPRGGSPSNGAAV